MVSLFKKKKIDIEAYDDESLKEIILYNNNIDLRLKAVDQVSDLQLLCSLISRVKNSKVRTKILPRVKFNCLLEILQESPNTHIISSILDYLEKDQLLKIYSNLETDVKLNIINKYNSIEFNKEVVRIETDEKLFSFLMKTIDDDEFYLEFLYSEMCSELIFDRFRGGKEVFGMTDFKIFKNYINGGFPDIESFEYALNLGISQYDELLEHKYRSRERLLSLLKKFSPDIPVVIGRIVELAECKKEEAISMIKEILGEHKVLGRYLELEQVFIRNNETDELIDALLAEYESMDGKNKLH